MAPRVTQVRASPGKATEGADGGTWEAGERVRRQVGTTLSSIVWSIREQAHGSGNRAESALRVVGGHRRSPSWLVGARIHGFGRAGEHRGGRRKPVHGGLAAASMPRTPPRCPPARPLTGSCAAQPRKTEQKIKIKSRSLRSHPRMAWIYPFSVPPVDPRHAWMDPLDIATNPGSADRRNLSKAGWVRLRGREPHGCGDRASMDGFTASPATGPPPPSHGKPAFALAVAVAPASAGAGRRPARALPPLPVQCRARFPTTVPRT